MGVHVLAVVELEKVVTPLQVPHTRFVVAVPVVATNWPALQLVWAWHQNELLAAVKKPGSHAKQKRSVVVVALVKINSPAMQLVAEVHAAALVVVENEPAAHVWQARSAVVDSGAD
jgi:hypothetical protein